MTIDEFIRYLDVHGADLDRWPPGLGGAARGVAATAEGRSAHEAARAFEALVAESLPVPPALGLKARILARLEPGTGPALPGWLATVRWRPLAAAAVAPLALGFVLGFAWPSEEDAFEDVVSVLAFSSVFEEELAASGGAAGETATTADGESDEE